MKESTERLLKIQNKLGLNQKQMAIYCGVSARTMNTWMTGERNCPVHVIELIERTATADTELIGVGRSATPMMRWAVVSMRNFTETIKFYGSKVDAVRAAQADWDHLTGIEKQHTDHHAVALMKCCFTGNHKYPFQNFENEDGSFDADWYEVAREWE